MRATVLTLVEVDIDDGVEVDAAAAALAPWVDSIEHALLARGMRSRGVRMHVMPFDTATLTAALERLAP